MSDDISDLFVVIIGIVACLGLSYLFGLITVALEHYSSSKIEDRVKGLPEARKKRLLKYDEKWKQILSASVFCRLAANMGVFAVPMVVYFYRERTDMPPLALVIGLILLSGLVFLLGYSIPRSVARRDEESIFLNCSGLIYFLSFLLFPLVLVSNGIDHAIGKMTGNKPEDGEKLTEEEILDMVSDGELEGVLEEQEKEMIENIISFNDLPVSEVMTNRSELTVIAADTTLEESTRLAVKAGHSRIPVIQGDRDNVIGVLYVKDLLRFWNNSEALETPVKTIMRTAFFVPESKQIAELFKEFQTNHVHFAVVLDEYGGTAGIITVEDILEEIVGEIEDEYDPVKTPELQQVGDNKYIIDARIQISDLNEELDAELPESDRYDTLGGLVMESLGHIPIIGESLTVGRYRFRVSDSNSRTVKQIGLEILPEKESKETEDGN